jgi:Mg2+ and Co2+ transporter CorA
VDGAILADHITGHESSYWMEQEQFSVIAIPEPTVWMEQSTWFHLVAIPETIISVHGAQVPAMDTFIRRRWLDRPGPAPDMAAVVLHLIKCYVEEETLEFGRIRLQVEQHAEGLRGGDQSFSVEHLEGLMTKTHHMATVFFEYQGVCEGIGFTNTRAISLGTQEERFRQGSQIIRRKREGVEQVQRRLEELQRQHLMDRQATTEGRLRTLTIISAVFLPLTLIAGIYGMNFVNMPELDDTYAYFVVLAGMGALGLGMISFFFWKGWFR